MDKRTERHIFAHRNAKAFSGVSILLRSSAPVFSRSHFPTVALSHALTLLLLLTWLTPACAAVRFDVFLGYDGILPQASWFPVAFEIQNDGPSFNGVVEISPGQFD